MDLITCCDEDNLEDSKVASLKGGSITVNTVGSWRRDHPKLLNVGISRVLRVLHTRVDQLLVSGDIDYVGQRNRAQYKQLKKEHAFCQSCSFNTSYVIAVASHLKPGHTHTSKQMVHQTTNLATLKSKHGSVSP